MKPILSQETQRGFSQVEVLTAVGVSLLVVGLATAGYLQINQSLAGAREAVMEMQLEDKIAAHMSCSTTRHYDPDRCEIGDWGLQMRDKNQQPILPFTGKATDKAGIRHTFQKRAIQARCNGFHRIEVRHCKLPEKATDAIVENTCKPVFQKVGASCASEPYVMDTFYPRRSAIFFTELAFPYDWVASLPPWFPASLKQVESHADVHNNPLTVKALCVHLGFSAGPAYRESRFYRDVDNKAPWIMGDDHFDDHYVAFVKPVQGKNTDFRHGRKTLSNERMAYYNPATDSMSVTSKAYKSGETWVPSTFTYRDDIVGWNIDMTAGWFNNSNNRGAHPWNYWTARLTCGK